MARGSARILQFRGLALLLGWLAAVPVAAAAQGGSGPEVPPPASDPDVAHEEAMDAQRAFERTRRRHYPRAAWTADACHEHIGRFCLHHDDDDGWVPEPDPPEVVVARDRLIAILDSAARVLPEDRWVLGQRVRYRLEGARPDEAVALASDCAVSTSWCEALHAFALHATGDHLGAELAFERSLDAMAPEARCAWEGIGPLLSGRDLSRYERLRCGSAARAAYERAFWHLSDPMWLVPGNERRAEHLARRVWIALSTDGANGYGLSWGPDLEELTIRYGWPVGWDVVWRRNPGFSTERSVRAHRPPDSQRYAVFALDRPLSDGGAEWRLEDDRPRSTWHPPYGRVRELSRQVAGFRREEGRVIVGAFSAPDSLGGCPVRSAAFLANAFGEVNRVETAGTLPVLVREPGSVGSASLVGLEVRCSRGPGAARIRTVLPPTGKWLSDLLLLDPVRELPGTLNAALFHARRRSTARAGESIVVFWEWYGAAEPASSLSVTLSLTREDESFWRKALEWSGLADRDPEEVGVRWSEPGDAESPGRALELRLPADLTPGRHRLTLLVQSARVGTVSSSREVVIIP